MPTPTPNSQFQVDNEPGDDLNGHRAKTPIISAIVSSSAVIIIWTLIFLTWLWKQYKKRIRAKRRAAKGLPPKIDKAKKPAPTFILPPDPAVITGQREPGERVIPTKHHSIDKYRDQDNDEDKDKGTTSASIELNERSRPITESGARDEMLARQIFSKHSPLDPPRHEKRHSRQASK
ncbi:hypothetical protein F5888DRAFT_1183583 [Russula emetica]|nr:hypothetical protein F5888DRAFT_1183583 [Russula emetica]